MSEELQKALEDFLAKVISGVEQAGEFAVDQIPDVIQQALTWFMVESLIYTFIGLCLLTLTGWLLRQLFKKGGWHEHEDVDIDMLAPPLIGLCAIIAIIGLIFVFSNTEWLQILVAPKWFIVSEMSKLI